MPRNSKKTGLRLREILEQAAGAIIATFVLTALGLGSSLVIGWGWTLVLLVGVGAIFAIWYKVDPSFQSLIRRRKSALRAALTTQLPHYRTWDTITDEALHQLSKETDYRGIKIAQRRLLTLKGHKYLELIFSLPRESYGNLIWYRLIDEQGNTIISYGGFPATTATCTRCGVQVLIGYEPNALGKPESYVSTIGCHWCGQQWRIDGQSSYQPQQEQSRKQREPSPRPELLRVKVVYDFGQDDFAATFDINSQTGKLLGQCGARAIGRLSREAPRKVPSIEIWLMDRAKGQKVTKLILSEHVFRDPAMREKFDTIGDVVPAYISSQLLLTTDTLSLQAQILSVEYGMHISLPQNSFFHRLALEVVVSKRVSGE